MPSLTQSFTKKRRRDEDESIDSIRLTFPQDYHDYFSHPHVENHGSSPRKIKSFPSPFTKKLRIATATTTTSGWTAEQPPPPSPSPHASPLSPPKHNPFSSRQGRSSSTVGTNKTKPTSTTTISTNLLSPCHICHRKPTKKTELDSYADCEGCGERTCYVCIRACLGWNTTHPPPPITLTTSSREEDLMRDEETWEETRGQEVQRLDESFTMEDAPIITKDDDRKEETWGKGGGTGTGHRGRICSQCCVEEGHEGEVICLGCLGT